MTLPVLLCNKCVQTICSRTKTEQRNFFFCFNSKTHVQKLIPFFTKQSKSHASPSRSSKFPTVRFHDSRKNSAVLINLASSAIVLSLIHPLLSVAIPSVNSQTPLLPSTPFSQSKSLQIGLEDGKIRPCPSINPGCVSTNPLSSSFAFPYAIPENDSENAVEKLKVAIMKTQRNPKIQAIEDTPNGMYLQAEVDGGFGRDVLEFLVKRDVVAYRSMAMKVTYVYPFTTAVGDAKGQQERIKKIMDQLGWFAPTFESMD